LLLLKAIFKGIGVTAVFGGIYFALNYWATFSDSAQWIDFVNVSTIITLPIFYGIMISKITPDAHRDTLQYFFWAPIFSMATLLLSYISGLEGLICVVIALAPFTLASMVGALIYYVYRSWRKDQHENGLRIGFIIPFIAIFAESQLPLLTNTHLVENKIEINAPIDVVFQSLKSIDDIRPEEVETNLTHYLNIPKPTSAQWQGTRRISNWGPDVRFIENITSIGENDHINWDFEFPDGWIKDGIEDHHIRIGGRHFSVDKGGYELRDLGNATELTLWTQTTDHTRLGAYAELWNDFFIGNFHEAILGVVKTRNEHQH
jgi:hypothetical protein